ncbi:MAG: methylenetetrahydrofolate reductase [NAD(P)H] [Nitrospinales bacterium]
MKINEILKNKQNSFSFEFFPPKSPEGFTRLFDTIENLKGCEPSFVSVTFGAGGSTRTKTIDLVGRIKTEIGLESMAHLTCVGSSEEDIDSFLDELVSSGIENVLALRGDPPEGYDKFVKPENGFEFANELVAHIKNKYDLCVGVAGYPEGHVECSDKKKDLENLKKKVDAGADFIITQLFFDNNVYFDFVDKVQSIGINIPIIPGIMPILNLNQVKRFTKMCGASIPPVLLQNLEGIKDDELKVKETGLAHAKKQCEDLLNQGAPGIHFYTLNKSTATMRILEHLNKVNNLSNNA